MYMNRVLREAKTSTENELNQLRLRNDALTSQLSMAQQALLNTANDKNNVISELRAELKMKSFELTTLGVSFEVQYFFLMNLLSILVVSCNSWPQETHFQELLSCDFHFFSSLLPQERMSQLRASELEVDVLRQEVSAHK